MDLRDECTEEKPGNSEFWEEVKQEGRPMSLISKPEAAMSGGKSRISESVSAEVRTLLCRVLWLIRGVVCAKVVCFHFVTHV